jgi:hypothetical protein
MHCAAGWQCFLNIAEPPRPRTPQHKIGMARLTFRRAVIVPNFVNEIEVACSEIVNATISRHRQKRLPQLTTATGMTSEAGAWKAMQAREELSSVTIVPRR